jgi:hypothetical protein
MSVGSAADSMCRLNLNARGHGCKAMVSTTPSDLRRLEPRGSP